MTTLDELLSQYFERMPMPTADTPWRCNDGRLLKIQEMSDEHLSNAICKIQREDWRWEWLDILIAEQYRRAEAGHYDD